MIACAQTQPGVAAAPKLETDDQKTLYALGFLLESNVKPFALTSDELAIDSLLDGSSTCGLAFTLSLLHIRSSHRRTGRSHGPEKKFRARIRHPLKAWVLEAR